MVRGIYMRIPEAPPAIYTLWLERLDRGCCLSRNTKNGKRLQY